MRDLGAEAVQAYGVSVTFSSPHVVNLPATLQDEPFGSDDEDCDDDSVDGIPMASEPAAAEWMAQKLKQDAKASPDAAPQPDLQQWYTARPLPSVD